MPKTLREARVLFTRLIADQVWWMNNQAGWEVAFDEVTERITAKDPTSDHMKNSLHHSGLAADILLYIDGDYQELTIAHAFAGERWERQHELCRWGGHFGDGNHYSIEWEGRK